MKKLLTAAALSALFVPTLASAQLYVGAGAGQSKTDSKETSFKGYVGLQFSPIWGIEAGYNDLHKYKGQDVDATTVAATGTFNFAERWSVLGKLGASSNRAHFAGASRETEFYAGVGVGLAMTKNIGLRLEYEDFGKLSDVAGTSNASGTNFGLSVKYLFN